jgi:ribose transport system permease protein
MSSDSRSLNRLSDDAGRQGGGAPEAAPPAAASRWRAGLSRTGKTLRRGLLSEYFVLYLTLAYVLVLWPFMPELFGAQNVGDVLSNLWPLLVIAVGQTFVLITAGIDLSQTSVMALSSVVGAMITVTSLDPILFSKSPLWGSVLGPGGGLLAHHPLAVPVAVVAMLAVGAVIGFLNGAAVAIFRMPAFIVTLVSMMFFSAVAIYLPKSENIRNLPDAFTRLGKGSLGPVPIPLLVGVVVVALAHFLLSRTLFGRRLYAIGMNASASTISGVPTRRIVILAYVISGLCAAVGSVLYSARLEMGRPTLGSMQFIDIVGANVIAGVSLAGGKGKVTWTVFGVLFFVLLANTLNLLDLPFYMIDVVKGLVIFGAAVFDVVRTRAAARST